MVPVISRTRSTMELSSTTRMFGLRRAAVSSAFSAAASKKVIPRVHLDSAPTEAAEPTRDFRCVREVAFPSNRWPPTDDVEFDAANHEPMPLHRRLPPPALSHTFCGAAA